MRVDVEGNLAFVADDLGGLQIVQFQGALSQPVINPILPNPATNTTINVNWNPVPICAELHPLSIYFSYYNH